MSNGPLNSTKLTKAGIAGAALAVVGIILFILLWVVLGQTGLTSLTRLIVSLCLPPVVIGGSIGVYVLVVKGRNGS